jgi:ketosteroid isomerase-like protein
MILSKVRYKDWSEIQEEYEDYMTSVGPWSLEWILSFFRDEYKDEENWAFSQEAIKTFMESDEHILVSDEGLDSLTNPSAVALRFNSRINARDLEGLASLMTDDHTFIDSSNDVHSGKPAMVEGWKEFFEAYPDYRNVFTRVEVKYDTVVLIGYSTCSHDPLDGPALWTAIVRDGKVSEWRVYLDTPENRTKLELLVLKE